MMLIAAWSMGLEPELVLEVARHQEVLAAAALPAGEKCEGARPPWMG